MSSFVVELWNSILTPGTTPALVTATHGSFVALLVTLLFLLFATRNYHFAILTVLATSLWAGVTWFIREIEIEKKRQEEQQKPGSNSELKSSTTATASPPSSPSLRSKSRRT
jgi:hypothetical protein